MILLLRRKIKRSVWHGEENQLFEGAGSPPQTPPLLASPGLAQHPAYPGPWFICLPSSFC
jgi:hypothetical protein